MSFLVDILEYVFSNKKSHVYSAFGQKDYFRIVNKLRSKGVKYRVRIVRDLSSRQVYKDNYTQYDFFVKKEDVGKAEEAIHRK